MISVGSKRAELILKSEVLKNVPKALKMTSFGLESFQASLGT